MVVGVGAGVGVAEEVVEKDMDSDSDEWAAFERPYSGGKWGDREEDKKETHKVIVFNKCGILERRRGEERRMRGCGVCSRKWVIVLNGNLSFLMGFFSVLRRFPSFRQWRADMEHSSHTSRDHM